MIKEGKKHRLIPKWACISNLPIPFLSKGNTYSKQKKKSKLYKQGYRPMRTQREILSRNRRKDLIIKFNSPEK